MRSRSSRRAVSMMIGVSPRARSQRVISRPSSLGSIRSSTTRSGRRWAKRRQGGLAVTGQADLVAGPLEIDAHDLADARLIFNHQNRRFAHAAPASR